MDDGRILNGKKGISKELFRKGSWNRTTHGEALSLDSLVFYSS